MRPYLFLFALFFASGLQSLFAQDTGATSSSSAPLELSLQECIEYALKNNINIQQSRLNLRSDEVALKQAKANLLPSLNFSSNASYSVGRTISQFSNEYVTLPVRQQSIGASTSLVLFNSFRRLNTIKRNQNNIQASQQNVEATKNDITLQVIDAYTQILFNRELLATTRIQLRTRELQLSRTRKLVNAGSLPSADALQLEAQVASDEAAVVNAENNLALAYLQLKQILQVSYEQPLEVVIPVVEVPEETALPVSAGAVFSEALNMPAVRSAELQIKSAEYDITIARSDYYPTLSLNAGLSSNYSSAAPTRIPAANTEYTVSEVEAPNYFVQVPQGTQGLPSRLPVFIRTEIPNEFRDNTYLNQLEFNLQQYVGLSLNIPIFNNWQVRTNVANAKIGLDNAQLNLINQRMQLRQNIEQAYLDAKSAAKSYAASVRQVASLQAAFKNTEIRYQAGGIDAVVYNQSKNELNAAESDLIRAKYQYIFSLKVLDFYQNKPIDF